MPHSNTIYLDHAATTPLLEVAAAELNAAHERTFGNSASSHHVGRQANEALEDCAFRVGKIFGVPSTHVIFTSGGTESNNLAIWGSLGGLSQGIKWLKDGGEGQLLTSVNEHDATKITLEMLEELGAQVKWLGVDSEGFLKQDDLEKALATRTKLLTIHHAQNEIGTVQDLKTLSALVRKYQPNALVHTDAVQSFLKVPVNMDEMGIDMLSISGHKIGAPKGIGALILGSRFENRHKPKLYPMIQGSGQQHGVRSGTVPVPMIASMTAAIEWGHKNFAKNTEQLMKLRKQLVDGLPKGKTVLNGPSIESDPRPDGTRTRSPQTVNFSVLGFPSGMMIEALSAKKFCISAGSACHSTNPKPNQTIMNLGVGKERAASAVRVSMSQFTTSDEVSSFLKALNEVISMFG